MQEEKLNGEDFSSPPEWLEEVPQPSLIPLTTPHRIVTEESPDLIWSFTYVTPEGPNNTVRRRIAEDILGWEFEDNAKASRPKGVMRDSKDSAAWTQDGEFHK